MMKTGQGDELNTVHRQSRLMEEVIEEERYYKSHFN